MYRIDVESVEQTRELGRRLADLLAEGDVVGLVGDLGAGKTTFVQAVARALGVPEEVPVTSPTFTFHRIYEGGRLLVNHVDLYRVESEADLESLGLDEVVGRRGTCLVEWFDRVGRRRPCDVLLVSMFLTGEESRGIEVRADGPRSRALLSGLLGEAPR